MRRLLMLLFLQLVLLVSCTDKVHDRRLQTAAALSDSEPDSALVILDKIDRKGLSESDRHLHDLLTVKSSDKAYITHESDSLILDVIGYYGKHKEDSLYAEALYYGGRVYSDLGDYPTALRHYHEALDQLPEDTPYRRLRGNALSQTGRLYDELKLFSQAIPYMEEVIRQEKEDRDTVNLVYDLQLLGVTLIRMEEYDQAMQKLLQAQSLSRTLPESFTAKTQMSLARIKFNQNDIDSALYYIRNSIDKVRPESRATALAYAARIYHDAGITDTAAIYARELIHFDGELNRGSAYRVLLEEDMAEASEIDSLRTYIQEYEEYLTAITDENERELTLLQRSLYNYRRHLEARVEAEKSKATLINWLYISVIVILILVSFFVIVKLHNHRLKMDLMVALDNISKLRNNLGIPEHETTESTLPGTEDTVGVMNLYDKPEEDIRERLRNELLDLYDRSERLPAVPAAILESGAYLRLNHLINQNMELRMDDSLWQELEELVHKCSPNFRKNLLLLTGGNLSSDDYKTSLLIKCGLTPTQISKLLLRSKGAITSRRETLCLKIFGKQYGSKMTDSIIRLL